MSPVLKTLTEYYNRLIFICCGRLQWAVWYHMSYKWHDIPILANMCWMLTGFLCTLYEGMINFKLVGLEDVVYAITYSVLFFKVTLFCHTSTNEARPSSIWVQKLLLEGNCRKECVEELKMFSFQLQIVKTNTLLVDSFH